jgi:hypothetical protein
MKNIIKIFIILIITPILISTGCSDAEEFSIKVKVLSAYDSFSGIYSADAEEDQIIEGAYLGSNLYTYEKVIELDSEISVTAFPASDSVTYLAIKIYQNDLLVAEQESETSPVGSVSLTYQLSDTETETDNE